MDFINQGIRYATTNNKEVVVLGFGIQQDTYTLNIPEVVNGYTVTEIKDKAFAENIHIHDVELPSSILRIGKKAFYKCPNLRQVKVNRTTLQNNDLYIGAGAFANCVKLEAFSAFRNICLMGDSVFENCKRLPSFSATFLSELPHNTFKNCEELHTFVFCDDNLKIANTAFDGCMKLNNITIKKDFEENEFFLSQIKTCTITCSRSSKYANLAYHGYSVKILDAI